ncbi:MAG: glycosyltransferase family 87 protein [Anaerolineae bacterium]
MPSDTLTNHKLIRWMTPLLIPRRLAYAKLLAGVLWTAWLVSLLAGPGYMDLAGQVVGTDFLQYYTAGYIVRAGDRARLYDLEYQAIVEAHIIGQELQDFFGFILPPFMAWLFWPFALLPYGLSFALWSIMGLFGLWMSLKFLLTPGTSPRRVFMWSLTWFPIFATIAFGQNSLLSLFLFALTYHLWRQERPFWAGMAASLLAYKPQLLLGLGLLWLLRWRKDWRALLGLGVGGSALVLLCFVTLPTASHAYIDFALTVLPELPELAGRQIWHTQTFHEFWLLLLPGLPGVANILRWILVGIGVVAFVRFCRCYREEKPLLYAGTMGLLIWISPHANIYEMSLLLVPALLLWEYRPELRLAWRRVFVLIWLAFLFSGPLTYAQLEILRLPFAVQIGVPVWAAVLYLTYTWLVPSRQDKRQGAT